MENSQWNHENAVHSFAESTEIPLTDVIVRASTSASQQTRQTKTPRTPKSQKLEKSSLKPGTSKGSTEFTLKTVVEFLILKGLCSIALWEKSLNGVKQKVSNLMNKEILQLYLNLKTVANAISVGIMQNSDLSQEKLELINENVREYEEIMMYVETILPTVNDPTHYSQEGVKTFVDLLTQCVEDEKTKETNNRNKSNIVINVDCDDDDDDDDKLNTDNACLKLFGSMDRKRKAKYVLVNQTFVLRSEDTVRRLTTPGEKGEFMVKIEVTDCNDLKGVNKESHWTKVWKKVIFVSDGQSSTYRKINEIILSEAEKIAKIKEVQTGEYESTDDRSVFNRKRARFTRN